MGSQTNKTHISNTAIVIGTAFAITALISSAIANAILFQSTGGQLTDPGLFYGSTVGALISICILITVLFLSRADKKRDSSADWTA